MDGLKLKRIFRHHVTTNTVASHAQLLFHTLWDEFDEAYWPENLSRRDALLCDKMQISENSLRNCRNMLKQMGFIEILPSKGRGKPTTYSLRTPSPEVGDSSSDSVGDSVGDSAYKIHTPNTLNPRPKKPPISPIEIPDEIAEEWAGFVGMRSKIKKPLTDRAKKLRLADLEKIAPGDYVTQRLILDQSTAANWQDLYPLKENRNGLSGRNTGQASAGNASANKYGDRKFGEQL